ncbi:hypothetical protein JCM10908_006098 [Rhodotorula pacifica]|uniref:uncharacterized protein n=1 Tax=Rhodotorula pacifica TaxID=1495444 RepID=UPI003180AF6F
MAPRRLLLWGLASTLLAIGTVVHALRTRSNFYAAAVYLAKSNACMMILWNQGIFQTVMLGKALQAVFLGDLRLIEVERLQERGWFAITETLLALTIFKDDFESTFVLLFVGLLFLKVFHWLASDRIEMMEQAAQVSRLAHARMVGLLALLWLADIGCLVFAIESIMIDGPTVMIMFASEYLILIASVWTLSAKYVINCIDMRSEAPWEEKSIYVFYVELAADFFKLCTYLTFFGLILTFYGLPLNILRDVYLTLRSFILKVRDLRRYRQATRNMDELYPNATREEMDAMADKTCIICREDMEWRAAGGETEPNGAARENSPAGAGANEEGDAPPAQVEAPPVVAAPRTGPNDTPKKLPCGHVFHFHCLRSWLERQQSCPTCRRPVLPNEQPNQPPRGAAARFGAPAGGAAAPAPNAPAGAANAPGQGPAFDAEGHAIRQAQINLARNLGREAFTSLFPGIPFPPEAENARTPGRADSAAAGLTTAAGGASTSALPQPIGASDFPLAGASAASAATSSSDNPLARFSLPSLPVPAGGEATLYQAPPSFVYGSAEASTSSYSNLAYGAYPQPSGPIRPPSSAASTALDASLQPPNVIERLEAVRRRWNAREAASNFSAAEASSVAAGSSAVEAPVPAVAATGELSAEVTSTGFTAAEKGKGKADEALSNANEEDISPREAALRAAERRLGQTAPTRDVPTRPSPPMASLSTLTVVPGTEPADERPPAMEGSDSASNPVKLPLPTPRLIPLFDPADPTSLLGETGTLTSVQVEGGVTKILEDKLRTLSDVQQRLDSLIGDLQAAIGT